MKRIIVCCLMAVVLLLGVLVPGCTAEPTEVVEIGTCAFVPLNNILMGGAPIIVDRLNEVCEGQVVWKLLGGPEVVPGLDQFAAVKSGALGGAFTVAGYYTADVPASYASSLSRLQPWEERESGFYEYMNEVHEAQGVHVVCKHLQAGQYLQFAKAAASLDDVAGRRMRASGNQLPPWCKALGMETVETPIPETYSALEKGIVDGIAYPVIGAAGYGFFEVINYIFDYPAYTKQNAFFIINKGLWDKIPKRLQDKIDDAMAETEHDVVAYYDQILAQEKQKAVDAGVTFVTLSPSEGQRIIDAAESSGWEFQKGIVSPDVYEKLRELTGY